MMNIAKRRRRTRKGPTVAGLARRIAALRVENNMPAVPKRRRQPRTRRRAGPSAAGVTTSTPARFISQAGTMVVQNEEYWSSITGTGSTSIGNWYFCPGVSGLAILDGLAKNFDRYVLDNVEIHYRTSAGTTMSGIVAIGVDWDLTSEDTYQSVLACFPRIRCACWQENSITLPRDQLMSRRRLMTARKKENSTSVDFSAFCLKVASKNLIKAELGEVWVRYKVSLQGPRSAPPALLSENSGLPDSVPTTQLPGSPTTPT